MQMTSYLITPPTFYQAPRNLREPLKTNPQEERKTNLVSIKFKELLVSVLPVERKEKQKEKALVLCTCIISVVTEMCELERR